MKSLCKKDFLTASSHMDKLGMTEEEFVGFYDQYATPMFRHCYFKTSDRDIAKDMMQETFTRVWHYIREGGEVTNPRAFLYTTANHLITDYYRKKKAYSLDLLREKGFDTSSKDHETIVMRADFERIIKLIKKMDLKYQDVLLLRFVDDLGPQEIAESLGTTENVVSVRIHRGIKQLRNLLV